VAQISSSDRRKNTVRLQATAADNKILGHAPFRGGSIGAHAPFLTIGGAEEDAFVKWIRVLGLIAFLCIPTSLLLGQIPPAADAPGTYPGGINPGLENLYVYASADIEITGPKGTPVEGTIVVSLIRLNGQVFKTAMAEHGKVLFGNVPRSELTAEVVAPGYQTAKKSFEIGEKAEVKVQIELQPMTDREAAAADRGISALNPKAQKDIGKALDALRNRPADARIHLQEAQRDAPNSAEVEYLYGVYASKMGDQSMAQTHWQRALELNPNHLSSLLAISQSLLQQYKGAAAAPYLTRALETEPSSWRAHMLMAQSDLFQGQRDRAIREAERAMELGHDQAASVEPLLAHALYDNGEKDRAIKLLTEYVTAHPSDTNSAKLLERLTNPTTTTRTTVTTSTAITPIDVPNLSDEMAVMPSNWLPPDVDEKIPPVEEGASCVLNDVVQKAGQQLQKFTHDVDRFTATESLTHESINRYGIASSPEKRKFDYLVSIQEIRQGYLGVTEYRNGGGAQAQFPEGLVTNGLPALVLVFHPYYAPNYEMTCEGLARTNAGLAWQVHFRQIPGRPNELKTYQFGLNGPSYAVALKGRAWISADNYQIVRMETDIVKPMPEIKLLAEHTVIEYGPVTFQKDNVNLWLPQSAEVYFAWRGRQVHRRHSFSNYMLFAIDDKERIEAPKNTEPKASGDSGDATKAQSKN